MRFFYYLTGLAFVVAGTSGFLLWRMNHTNLDVSDIANQVAQIKNQFQQAEKPIQKLDVEKFRQQRASKELIDPKKTLPQYAAYPFDEVSSLYRYAQHCKDTSSVKVRSPDLQKAFIWQRFACGDLSRLPTDFFNKNPMMHPSGSSYVSLAIHSSHQEFRDPHWIEQNQNKLHLLEVINLFSNSTNEIKFSAWELQNILNSETFIKTKKYILIADQGAHSIDVATYSTYPIEKWDVFIKTKNYLPNDAIDSPNCLLKEGNICWTINPDQQTAYARILLSILLGCFSLLGLVLVSFLIKRSQQQKIESEKRLFTLQMLTHELRTPATSLHLSVETLRREFDQLPPESQKSFLRMCDELQRLDRVVDASKQYLQPSNDISYKNNKHASINAMVESMLAPYSNQIVLKPLAQDQQINLDRYWLEICIKNLVENAIHHGKLPVTVELSAQGSSLDISVSDQGNVSASLDDMLTPFHKGTSSKGLGLGLSIVKKIVGTMNGELTFKSNPTTFSIRLKGYK